MAKEEDILNPCGHRNSERVKALKELPSSICPACLFERIKELEAENKQLKKVIETAISQHHRVRPNTVVDILIREYEALKG